MSNTKTDLGERMPQQRLWARASLPRAPSGTWTDVSMRRNSGYGWAVGTSDAAGSATILQHIPTDRSWARGGSPAPGVAAR